MLAALILAATVACVSPAEWQAKLEAHYPSLTFSQDADITGPQATQLVEAIDAVPPVSHDDADEVIVLDPGSDMTLAVALFKNHCFVGFYGIPHAAFQSLLRGLI